MKVLIAQSCLTLCDPMDCSICPWNSPGKNPGVDCHSLLQGIFLTQGSNLGLPRCRQTVHHLSHQRIIFNHWYSWKNKKTWTCEQISSKNNDIKSLYIHTQTHTYAFPIFLVLRLTHGFPGGSAVKSMPASSGDGGSIPGLKDPLEKEMATHSSILTWRNPWIGEPDGLQSMGSQKESDTA